MQLRFSFKHMDTSPALKQYAEEKIQHRIEKFVTKPIEAHLTFSVEGHLHIVHCNVVGGDNFSCQVEAETTDMYGSVDLMVDRLAGKLKRTKDKLKHHKHGENLRNMPTVDITEELEKAEAVDAADIPPYEKARSRG